MTQNILTDLGEEYLMKNGLDGATVDIGVYSDSTDNISDSDDIAAIGTEPTSGNYNRQTVNLSALDVSGNWGADNDSAFSFDFSDVTSQEYVDTFFLVINFQAADTGDGSANDHLVANVAMTTDRDIGSLDTLDVAAGDIELTID